MTKKGAALAILLSLIVSLGVGGGVAAASDDENNVRLVIYEDRAMFVFMNYLSDEEYMANDANSLFAGMPEGLNEYLMIVPSRITFEVEELRAIAADEKAARQYVVDRMDPAVVHVDAFAPLEGYAGDLNDIFFRLDHHWTQLGAYYAAEAFFKAAGMPYHKLDEYKKKDGKPFLGYLYLVSEEDSLGDNPDSLVYYQLPGTENKTAMVYDTDADTGVSKGEEKLLVDPSREGYAIFVDNFGFSHAVIPGDTASDRALMLIGGSSMYAMAPLLADNFRTVVLIEGRYYSGGAEGLRALIDEYGITDVLLCISFSTHILGI